VQVVAASCLVVLQLIPSQDIASHSGQLQFASRPVVWHPGGLQPSVPSPPQEAAAQQLPQPQAQKVFAQQLAQPQAVARKSPHAPAASSLEQALHKPLAPEVIQALAQREPSFEAHRALHLDSCPHQSQLSLLFHLQ
jgi:hypothetical protein